MIYLGAQSTPQVQAARAALMVQSGLHAPDAGSLPHTLQARQVGNFRRHARGTYRLDWTHCNLDWFGIRRPATNYENQAIVTARFADGWTLACLACMPRLRQSRCAAAGAWMAGATSDLGHREG